VSAVQVTEAAKLGKAFNRPFPHEVEDGNPTAVNQDVNMTKSAATQAALLCLCNLH
jgi:hypothetical protein